MTTKGSKTVMISAVVSMVVLSGLLVILPLQGSQEPTSPGNSSLPSSMNGASFAVVTLYNNQSVATPSPFQQELAVNSSSYSSLEVANLSNVEFMSLGGQIIPSWLESGNSNVSTNSVYWLNITGIPAHSSVAIYIVFLPRTEIAFNGINVGEAAQLSGPIGSSTFGMYNDIAAVMSPGLLYNFYVPTTAGNYAFYPSGLANTSLAMGSYVPSPTSNEMSTVTPYNTSLTGHYGNRDGTYMNNLIFNYQYQYSGGIPFPNPPVIDPGRAFAVKAIGWTNVPLISGYVAVLTDDGTFIGSSTTGGNSSGIGWINTTQSQTNVLISWGQQAASFYSGNFNYGTFRVQVGYENTGGPAYFAMYTAAKLEYYHAVLPPNNAMPTSSFSPVVGKLLYSVTFTPSGLNSNVNWTLSVAGYGSVLENGIAPILLELPNGTYSYQVITSNATFAPVNPVGTFTVSGASQSLSISFYLVTYEVTFRQAVASKIQTGTTWYANITGPITTSLSTTANNTTVQLTNGTYHVLFGSVEPSLYQAVGYAFTVNGASTNQSVSFTSAYLVTYTETGLPSGTTWFVNVTDLRAFSSSTASITSYQPNGSYSYSVATVNKSWSSPGGQYTVSGSSFTVPITFTLVTYNVQFVPQNLQPPGLTWYLNGTEGQFNLIGTGATPISDNLANGTYYYSVHTTNNTVMVPPGNFTVNGSAISVPLNFLPVVFNVNFTETGLGYGTPWYVNVSNVSYFNTPITSTLVSSSNYNNSLSLLNGTYNYTVSSGNSIYRPTEYSGKLTIAGSDITVALTFEMVVYSVNFTEVGLPSGTSWSLDSGSLHLSSTGSVINHMLHNGTYVFNVSTQGTGYAPFLQKVVLTVSGSSVNFTVQFVQQATSVTFTVENLPSTTNSWYLNISGGPSIVVKGQAVSLNLAYGTHSYTVGIAGKGTVYSGSVTVGSSPLNIYINLTGASSAAIASAIPAQYNPVFTALQQPVEATSLMEVAR